jgi:hypothetical protein
MNRYMIGHPQWLPQNGKEGLEAALTLQSLADVIAYLQNPGSK